VCGNNKKHKGFFLTEVVVASAILGILFAGLALSLRTFARLNHYELVRQRCIAAAQAELDSLTVTGEPISDEDFKRLWPGLSVSIEKSEATGQWQGMKLAEVTTSGRSFRKEVKVKLSRYTSGESIFHRNTKQGHPVKEEG